MPDNPTTPKDRLYAFVDSLGIPMQEFAKICRIMPTTIYADNGELRNVYRERIFSAFPQLNPVWLQLGEGEMIRDFPNIQTSITKAATRVVANSAPKRKAISKKQTEHGNRTQRKSSKRASKDYGVSKWREQSVGYKWALDKVMEGVPRTEIIAEFNRRHESNPEDYSTRGGKPLSSGILSYWIKKSEISPPVSDKPHPYKKQETTPQTTVSIEVEKPTESQEDNGSEIHSLMIERNDLPVELAQIINPPTEIQPKSQNKIKHPKKIDWEAIFKGVALVIGIIGGGFLIAVIISEFVLPAIIMGLLFLSFLFGKK